MGRRKKLETREREQLSFLRFNFRFNFNFFNFLKFYIIFHILYLLNDILYFRNIKIFLTFFQQILNPLHVLARLISGLKNKNILEINTFLIIIFLSFILGFSEIRKNKKVARKIF